MSKLVHLRIEHRKEPIGIDTTSPSIAWMIESTDPNLTQRGYSITLTDEHDTVMVTLVESNSCEQLRVLPSLPLTSLKRYTVNLSVTLSNHETLSATTTFETGLLTPKEWTGQWIAAPVETPVPVFIKQLQIMKSVSKARLLVVSRGVYDAQLDGQKIGNDLLAPGWTSYRHRIPFQMYPVSLQQGDHELAITLAPGWFAGLLGFTDQRYHYGQQLSVLAELHITYTDGTSEVITTDDSWEYTMREVQSSELYLGETVDFTKKIQPHHPVLILPSYEGDIVSQEQEPVQIMREFEPIKRWVTPKGESVIDFGQNISGFVRLELTAPEGKTVTINHAETLDKEGNFYPDTLRTAVSIDTFVSDGQDRWVQPRFTFHGFRYIRLQGDFDLETIKIVACAIRSSFESPGSFETSHPLIQRLFKNIQWSHWDNFVDIPTDCPQRNERLGWTGDAQIFAKTATLLSRTASFYSKWLKDLALEQTPELGVTQVVPNILGEMPGIAAWSDAATIIPWTLYQQYGDKRILQRQLSSMIDWVDYVQRQTNEAGLWQQGFQYGDWLGLDKEEGDSRTGATDVYFVANSYYLYSTNILVQALEILEDPRSEHYRALYDDTLLAFQEEYFTKTGRLVTETQTACVLALYFNLAPENARHRIQQILVTNIVNHKKHLTTGFIGTPYLNLLLSEVGEHDLASDIFLQEDYPSWLYAVKKGATTIWERWNSIKPDGSFDESGMNSLNHYAYGSIAQWLFEKVAGIEPLSPGYQTFKVQPNLVKGMTDFKAAIPTPYGTIRSEWRVSEGKIYGTVNVPVNTHATIILPDTQAAEEVGSGEYRFEYNTTLSLHRPRFSQETTVGALLQEEKAISFLREYAPETLDNQMFQLALSMTIGEISAYSVETKQLFDALLAVVNS